MFTNVDVRGVSRGQCTTDGCECDGFTRPSSLETRSIQVAPLQCGWCCYCGHSPVCHSRIVAKEVANNTFQPEISSVNWGYTVHTPFPDVPMLDHAGREGRMESKPAQLVDTLQVADCHPSKYEPEVTPEPQPEPEPCLQREATPQPQAAGPRQESPVQRTPPRPESSSTPNRTSVQKPEPGPQPPKKRSCIEQGTGEESCGSMSHAPSEPCQEFSSCTCGLREKVEQLEREKQVLVRQLADARNVAGKSHLTKEKRAKIAAATGIDAGSSSSEEEPCCSSAEQLKRFRSRNSVLKFENASLKRRLESAEKAADCTKKMQRLQKLIENTRSGGSANVVLCPKVQIDIGNGILVEETIIRKLERWGGGPGSFARSLLRHLFTAEELKEKSLFGQDRSHLHKHLPVKKGLDPVRVNAIIDYTCAKFPRANPRLIKSTLSSMLSHHVK